MQIKIIGDTIEFDSYTIGQICTALPQTVRERFVDLIDGLDYDEHCGLPEKLSRLKIAEAELEDLGRDHQKSREELESLGTKLAALADVASAAAE